MLLKVLGTLSDASVCFNPVLVVSVLSELFISVKRVRWRHLKSWRCRAIDDDLQYIIHRATKDILEKDSYRI